MRIKSKFGPEIKGTRSTRSVLEVGKLLSHCLAPDETWSEEKGAEMAAIMRLSPDARKAIKELNIRASEESGPITDVSIWIHFMSLLNSVSEAVLDDGC